MDKTSDVLIFVAIIASLTIITIGLAGFYAHQNNQDVSFKKGTDYIALVNKQHKLPENWYDKVDLVPATNVVGDEFEVERKTLEHFIKLRKTLLSENIQIELDSATRTPTEQQTVWDNYKREKGEEYCKKYISPPGYSEHHTGLAIDIYLIKDGNTIRDNDSLLKEREVFAKIHEKLSEYGFVLRYPEGKDSITGYTYEPWHFRYVGEDIAKEISREGITLEEYLNKKIIGSKAKK